MGQPFPNGTFLPDELRSTTSPFLRNSRNPVIDEKVVPGPYKEVLPCDDLCYNVVQSCPASMGFMCPLPGNIGFNQSYGTRPLGVEGIVQKSTQITCNYPGAAYFLAAGERLIPSRMWVWTLVMGVMFI
jgi:calcium channel MID1